MSEPLATGVPQTSNESSTSRRGLRVLFVTNSSTQKCGVRIYGELWMQALRATGVEIIEWDGAYPAIYERGYYLPSVYQLQEMGVNLIHLNWDPQAINHFLPEHFEEARAAGIALSVFMHDVPPNSTCPVQGIADVVFAHEPGEGIVVIDHAVPDYRSTYGWQPWESITIGTAGIRDDPGVKLVDEVCRAQGWQHSKAGESGWLSTEKEINRLAWCTVNVAWYATSGRGKSMGAMFMVAAQRPLILSGSSMFSALWPYASEIFIDRSTHGAGFLDDGPPNELYAAGPGTMLSIVVRNAQHGADPDWPNRAVAPVHAATDLAWSRLAPVIRAHWQEILHV